MSMYDRISSKLSLSLGALDFEEDIQPVNFAQGPYADLESERRVLDVSSGSSAA